MSYTQPIGLDGLPLIRPLRRISGGYETDVYRMADERYVVKVKHIVYGSASIALAQALLQRAIAERFAAFLGVEHSVPSTFVVAYNHAGDVQVVTIQPFLKNARPLYTIDYPKLPRAQRHQIMTQLGTIIRRAQICYRTTGMVPDVDGLSAGSPREVARLRAPHMAPIHVWNFLIVRALLRSHNLLLTTDNRVVLVDYDLVMLHKPHVVHRIYSAFRALLFWRDLAVVWMHSNR